MRQRAGGRKTRRGECELSETKACLLSESVRVDRRATVWLAVRVVVDWTEECAPWYKIGRYSNKRRANRDAGWLAAVR